MNHKQVIVISVHLLGTLLGLSGCDDFIAEDISEAQIVLSAPVNGASATQNEVTFWWEPLEVNTSYRLQVVTPSFAEAASLILDTLVTTHQVRNALDPGTYAWRVRAENGTYRSVFSATNAFTVTADEQPTTEEEQAPTGSIQLETPDDNYFTNQRTVTFAWIGSRRFTNYQLRLRGDVEQDLSLTQTSTAHTFAETDATVSWQIVGSCEGCTDVLSATRTLTLDFTKPEKPVLEGPEDQAVMSGTTVELSWRRDSEDVAYDQLYLYDQNEVLLPGYPAPYTGSAIPSFITLSDPEPGNYLWRVSSVDRAGNISDFSPFRSFTVQ